ncbi:MAG: hypothetical protein ACJARD_001561 [Alphaproteobacteria bacterium]|jgi:hypothetical protein
MIVLKINIKIVEMSLNLKDKKFDIDFDYKELQKNADQILNILTYKIAQLTQKKQHKLALAQSNKRDEAYININIFRFKDIKKNKLKSHYMKHTNHYCIVYDKDTVIEQKFKPQDSIAKEKYHIH